jgi:hypothetical protein
MAIRNSSTLQRWSSFKPGTRMPDSIAELELSDQLALQSADPDLYALLSNTATAELEMAALANQLDAAPVPQAERMAAANRAEAERLIAEGAFPTAGRYEGETYIPGREGSLTAQFAVEALAPDLAERERLRVSAEQAPANGGMSAEDVAFVHAEMARSQVESLQLAAQAAQGVY